MRFVAVLSISLIVATAPAHAISRHTSINLTCNAIGKIIDREGVTILRFPARRNGNLYLFDRYVANASMCPSGEAGRIATVPAKDTKTCPVLKCFPFGTSRN